jgi:CRISPR system Cascade subunit CasC
MNVLELHKIQSYPVSCLNRDDVGSPKTAIFGGVQRSRISSQCAKRAMREYWQKAGLKQFKGFRTKFVKTNLESELSQAGMEESQVAKSVQAIMKALGKIDDNKPHKLSTLIFISPEEIKRIAEAVAETPDAKNITKLVTGALKGALPRDAADIALFGRMFADAHELSVDAACMVAHPISTHKSSNELDFFTAMDENKPDSYESEEEEEDEGRGAGMMDSAQFSSATFYHYAALNLDMLANRFPDVGERKAIVKAFTEAFAKAMPGARRTTHNASTLPVYVLATVHTGQPMQLVNAFESPVRASGSGYEQLSVDRLLEHRKTMKKTWDLSYDLEVSTPEVPFSTLLNEVVARG